jgi:hypothetical protein
MGHERGVRSEYLDDRPQLRVFRWRGRPDLNRHGALAPADFKTVQLTGDYLIYKEFLPVPCDSALTIVVNEAYPRHRPDPADPRPSRDAMSEMPTRKHLIRLHNSNRAACCDSAVLNCDLASLHYGLGGCFASHASGCPSTNRQNPGF